MMLKVVACCAAVLASGGLSPQPSERRVGIQRLLVPDYPAIARLAQVGGDVRLTIMVEPTGKVSAVKSASGLPLLVQHATANILRWSYTPLDTRTELDG